MVDIAIAGASGYVGGELLRLLLNHPEVRIGALTAASNAGRQLGEFQPHLAQLATRELTATTAEILAGHDVVFLALPHGASAELAAKLPDTKLIIDCGADHRLVEAADWAEFYSGPHAGSWAYGLPELPLTDGGRQRTRIAAANRIAVPGCYPTNGSLAMAPALMAGLVEPRVVVVAASGTSGAGRAPQERLLASEIMGAMSAYSVGGTHRHTPEFEQNLSAAAGRPVRVSFTPTLAPMPRGILATSSADLTDTGAGLSDDELRQVWLNAYSGEPFVEVLPAGRWPNTGAVAGSNRIQIQVAADRRAGRLIVVSALDNLTKGTAGAAIQCMNLALGLSETNGLPISGLAP